MAETNSLPDPPAVLSPQTTAPTTIPLSQFITGATPHWPLNFLSSPSNCIRTLPTGGMVIQPQLTAIPAGTAQLMNTSTRGTTQFVSLTTQGGGNPFQQLISPFHLAQVPVSIATSGMSPIIAIQLQQNATSL